MLSFAARVIAFWFLAHCQQTYAHSNSTRKPHGRSLLGGIVDSSGIEVGMLAQVEHFLLFNGLVEHAQKVVVGVVHREDPRLLQLLEELLSVRGATYYQCVLHLRRMRDVHGVPIRENAVPVADIAQMLQPLHLVVGVVHERLIEPRQSGMSLHHHVRLLCVRRQTAHIQQIALGEEPVAAVVIVEMLPGTEGLASLLVQTGPQLLLRTRVERVVPS